MYESYRNPYQYQNPYVANLNMQNNPIQDNMIVSVPSEQEVRNYLVAIGHTVTFKVENQPLVLYTKTVNSQFEAPIIKIFDMVERKQETPVNAPQNDKPMDLSVYVTKDEFGALQKELNTLKQALGEGDKT